MVTKKSFMCSVRKCKASPMFTGTVRPKMAEGYIMGLVLSILIAVAIAAKNGNKNGEDLALLIFETSLRGSIALSFCLGAFFALKVILCRW